MSWRDVLGNFWNTHRRHGPVAALVFTWSALRSDTRHVYLFGLSRPRPVPEAEDAARSHVFRLAAADEIAGQIAAGTGMWSDRDLDAARRGDRCLMQWDGDRLVGYTWASAFPLVFLMQGVHINLPADAAYIYKAYTAPEYRGHGFQALRRLEILRMLEPEGKRRLFSYVERDNFESLKGLRKSGDERIGEIRLVRRGGELRVSLRISSAYWSDLRRV